MPNTQAAKRNCGSRYPHCLDPLVLGLAALLFLACKSQDEAEDAANQCVPDDHLLVGVTGITCADSEGSVRYVLERDSFGRLVLMDREDGEGGDAIEFAYPKQNDHRVRV